MKHLIVIVGILCITATAGWGETIHVPSEAATIQEGIDAAANRDTVLVADGTYCGTGNRNIDFDGKNLVLRSENGPDVTVIDCEGDGRGLYFHSGENWDAVVHGFTVTNGYGEGGGIYCVDSSPVIRKCIITGNTNGSAGHGGGIYCSGGTPVIMQSTISQNSTGADGYGGGLYARYSSVVITRCTISDNSAAGAWGTGGGLHFYSSTPTMVNCTVSDNYANDGGGFWLTSSPMIITGCLIKNNSSDSGDFGGGLAFDFSDIRLTHCAISGNSGGWGGGVFSNASSPILDHCELLGNTATYDGGGITCRGGNPLITHCIISGNRATYRSSHGGGVRLDQSDATVTDCVITGNSTAYSGGGIECYYCTAVIDNCTVTGNTVTGSWAYGGGISCYAWAHPVIRNCTVTGNSLEGSYGGGGGMWVWDSDPDIANCIFWNDEAEEIFAESGDPVVTFSDVQGGWEGEGNIDGDPLFVDPGVGDFRLGPGSPCIDSGTATGAPDHDIEGDPRPLGAGFDMGSDEYSDPPLPHDLELFFAGCPDTLERGTPLVVTGGVRNNGDESESLDYAALDITGPLSWTRVIHQGDPVAVMPGGSLCKPVLRRVQDWIPLGTYTVAAVIRLEGMEIARESFEVVVVETRSTVRITGEKPTLTCQEEIIYP